MIELVLSKKHKSKIFRDFISNNKFTPTLSTISDITIFKVITMTTKTNGKSGNNYNDKDDTIYYSSLPSSSYISSYSRIILALKSYSLG